MTIHPDDADFHYDTEAEADRGYANAIGAEYPERAWILSDRDVWYPNPYYQGPKVPHPESEPEGEEPIGFDSPRQPEWTGFDSQEMDDIPF